MLCHFIFWIVGTLRLHRAILHTKLCICVYIYIAEQHNLIQIECLIELFNNNKKKNFTCIFNSFTKVIYFVIDFFLFLFFVHLKNEKKFQYRSPAILLNVNILFVQRFKVLFLLFFSLLNTLKKKNHYENT